MIQFNLPNTESGLKHILTLTLSLRAAGYSTRVTQTHVAGFTLQTLTATPKKRLSRKRRGL